MGKGQEEPYLNHRRYGLGVNCPPWNRSRKEIRLRVLLRTCSFDLTTYLFNSLIDRVSVAYLLEGRALRSRTPAENQRGDDKRRRLEPTRLRIDPRAVWSVSVVQSSTEGSVGTETSGDGNTTSPTGVEVGDVAGPPRKGRGTKGEEDRLRKERFRDKETVTEVLRKGLCEGK